MGLSSAPHSVWKAVLPGHQLQASELRLAGRVQGAALIVPREDQGSPKIQATSRLFQGRAKSQPFHLPLTLALWGERLPQAPVWK